MEQTVKEVRSKDRVPFHCRACGACCRNIEDQVMLEAYDAYRLGRHLRDRGVVDSIEDVYAKYAHPIMLSDGFPIFVLNVADEDHHCVFLQNGRCSIYEARLRVCRLYPFTVKNGDRGRRFLYYQCLDRHASHFDGGTVFVNDWMYANFSKPERILFEKETAALPELGRRIRQLTPKHQEHFLFQMLYYRYYNFELDQPFLEQYDCNQRELFRALEEVIRQKA